MKLRNPAIWILPVAAIPRFWAAWFDHGVFWPDEIYQSLEQAHRAVFGIGFVPWEFQLGARSWLFPGFFSVLWWIARLLGVRDSLMLVAIAKSAMALMSLAGVWAGMRFARRLGGFNAELFAGVIGALLPSSLAFGSRAIPDPVAGTLVALAAVLLLEPGTRRSAVAGGLLGLAMVLRPQNALFSVAVPPFLLLGGRRQDAFSAALGTALALGLCGILDIATWGRPMHWVFVYSTYLRTNLFRPAVSWPEPWWYYPWFFASSSGIAAVAIGAGLLASLRSGIAAGSGLVLLVYLVALSLIPHKELRYLTAIIPLAMALSGLGLARLLAIRQPPDWFAIVAAAILALLLGWHTTRMTCQELGFHVGDEQGGLPPWHLNEPINVALHEAGLRRDLCGLAVGTGPDLVFTGGYTYFHRNAPLIGVESNPGLLEYPVLIAAANYQLAKPDESLPSGFTEVSRLHGQSLRRRDGPCERHPELDQRLMERP